MSDLLGTLGPLVNLGTLGILCIEASYLPQIGRLFRLKHADDVSVLDPPHVFDAKARGVEVDAQQRRALGQGGGAQDVGAGLGRGAIQAYGLQAQARSGRLSQETVAAGLEQAFGAVVGEQDDADDADQGEAGGRDDQARRNTDAWARRRGGLG